MNEQYQGQESGDMSLPQPVERAPGSSGYAYEAEQTKAVEADQPGSGQQAAPSQSHGSTQPPQAAPDPPASAATPVSLSSDDPQMADDVDLIEKEWVLRAKRIVEQTKNDPHRQSEELHATGTEYQRQRFGRDTNLTDAA